MPTHDTESMVALRGDTARTRGRTLFSVLLSNRLSLASSTRPPHRWSRRTVRWSLPAGLERDEIGRLYARNHAPLTAMIATFVANLLPIGLSRAGIDPALASGPVATVAQDILSMAVYLGIASLIL